MRRPSFGHHHHQPPFERPKKTLASRRHQTVCFLPNLAQASGGTGNVHSWPEPDTMTASDPKRTLDGKRGIEGVPADQQESVKWCRAAPVLGESVDSTLAVGCRNGVVYSNRYCDRSRRKTKR